MKLSPRRRRFAHEYVKNGFNGVQAIYAAGYNQGYESACVEASRLLRNAKVKAIVEDSLKKAQMSADEVLDELAVVARTETKIDGAQKLKALELLGKGHKLFTDKVEHNVVDGLVSKLQPELPDVSAEDLHAFLVENIQQISDKVQ